MRVKFKEDVTYVQNKKEDCREYKSGQVYDLAQDHANRWLKRGKAEAVADEPQPVRRAETNKSEKA